MIHQMILNSKSLPLVNRLSKQDFTYNIQAYIYNFTIEELAYKEKIGGEIKSTLKIATPEFEK